MQKKLLQYKDIAALILVNVMWGMSFIFSKTALSEGMPVMTLALIRFLIAAVILVPICLKTEGGIRLGRWAPLALWTTLLGITVYFYFEHTGIKYTTASAASLILSLVPMLTLLFRVLFCHGRIGPVRWLAVGVSLTGAYLVIMTGGEGAGTLKGNLLMVCACLCWTAYILCTPRLMENCSSMRVSTWQAIAAVITLVPFSLAERAQWVPVSGKAWLCILMLAAGCSALGYVLYNDAIRTVDSLTVSLTININPIAACLGGAMILGERMTGMQLLGGVMIIASMLIDTLETSGVFGKNKG